MDVTSTEAGTPVIDMTEGEYAGFLEDQVQFRMGMSVAQFTERYLAGSLDEEGDPDVPLLVGMLWIGQDGHRSAAA